MSFQLVIAEKPSVARSIATVIGATEKQNGYWQGGGYLVSWCIGHLVSFAEAGQYDEKYCKWRYEDLPILPQPWQFVVPDEKKQQFEVLRALLNRPDVDSVTAATDAGREGELIFRFVYQMAGCTKPVKRLWISSMEDAAIREGFANLRPDSDYDALYQSALCRAKADWLVGINATRLFSVLYHKTLTVGRVQTPTLKMLVDRDAKILRFQKEKYYTVGIQSGSLKADSGRIADAETANSLKEKCTGAVAVCTSVKREKKTEQPPKLYDLTTLQREANRLFGFTAKQTLDYAQQLYEKKLLTYPRTDSQYLTEDMGQTAQHLVSDLLELLPFAQELDLTPEVGRILNSKKVSDHHAILPTAEFVKQGFTGLAESECKLMNLVCSKLLCAVAAPPQVRNSDRRVLLCRERVHRQGKNGACPRMERDRPTVPLHHESRRRRRNGSPEHPAGTGRGAEFPRNFYRIGTLHIPAESLHRRYAPVSNGAGRGRGYAGGSGTQGAGYSGHPCGDSGKAGANGLCAAQGQTACPHQGRHQSGGGSAGKPDLSRPDRRMGKSPDRDCQGQCRRGRVHGRN